jgi:ribosomal protein L31E
MVNDPEFPIRVRVNLGYSSVEAAERIEVSVRVIDQAAEKLWGRSLNDEHVARVKGRVPAKGASPRSVDAVRGHVTRQLLAELREELKKKKGSR